MENMLQKIQISDLTFIFFCFANVSFSKWGCNNDCNLFKNSGNRPNHDRLVLCDCVFEENRDVMVYSGHILSFMSRSCAPWQPASHSSLPGNFLF